MIAALPGMVAPISGIHPNVYIKKMSGEYQI